ncbi:alpha/beta fold hydrolase [Burkholderiaceae bacterium FT117]|uniref:alpha/beta hydrolase n=1 Tax=Zeimonas sediminis TaxID=2944268 RepID=UPI002342FA41|nr:alpha/beta hydrolase [Zeimonas sediminis]MCM5569348.1 alpha/beta fold hydrolase [Zeimonas sediminis]
MSARSPLIVFSHANSFPAGTYGLLFRSLRARGIAVKAIEKFGHDPRYPVTSNWPHLVRQLADFAAPEIEAHAGPAFLVGHSLGGFLSLMCAARNPLLGGRGARGVLLLDSPLLGGWRARTLGLVKLTQLVGSVSPGRVSRRRRYQWPSADAALEHFMHKRAFADWHPQVLRDYVEHAMHDEVAPDGTVRRVLDFDRDIETRIYNTLPHNLDRLLRRHPLQCPVGFIGGTRSLEMRQIGFAMTRKVVGNDRPERLRMIEGSHLFPMERPLETAAAIEAMLAGLQGLAR